MGFEDIGFNLYTMVWIMDIIVVLATLFMIYLVLSGGLK